MGFLDRLRGRAERSVAGGGANSGAGTGVGEAQGSVDASGSAGPVSSGSTASTASAPAVALAAWPGLPPIQRASAVGGTGVADAGFGARLPTWQNPSFTGAGFRAVLDAERSARIAGASMPASSARAVPSLGQPAGELPLAGRPLVAQPGPVVPLRASAGHAELAGPVVQRAVRAVPLASSEAVGVRSTASTPVVGSGGAVGSASGIRVTAVSAEQVRSAAGSLTRSSAAAVQRRLVGQRNSAAVGDRDRKSVV